MASLPLRPRYARSCARRVKVGLRQRVRVRVGFRVRIRVRVRVRVRAGWYACV